MVRFIINLVGDHPDFRAKELRAKQILEDVWNSSAFLQQVVNYSRQELVGRWWWKKMVSVSGFSTTSDSTNAIYKMLISKQVVTVNQDIVSCEDPSTIGYEEDGDATTYVCIGWDVELDVFGVANNVAHEFCHQLGYHHASPDDCDSVPYAVGNIVESIARNMKEYMNG